MTAGQILAQIKATEISSRDYRMLTDGANDAVGLRCCEKAQTWILAKCLACGQDADFESEITTEAWIKRSLYELYSFAENEKVAKDKAEDALTFMAAILGDCVNTGEVPTGEESTTLKIPPMTASGVVKTGEVPEFLTGYRRPTLTWLG